MIPVGFRPTANQDLLATVVWYESQQAGLGGRFLEEVDPIIQRIEDSPDQFPTVYRDVRRALMSRFPFGVFFRTLEDQSIVIAIVDLRRNPGHWQKRR